jgi:uncharacterized membrane protein
MTLKQHPIVAASLIAPLLVAWIGSPARAQTLPPTHKPAARQGKVVGFVGLGILRGGLNWSSATAVSADGKLAVGAGSSGLLFDGHAFAWSGQSGLMPLPKPPGNIDFMIATDVSPTGTRVVGFREDPGLGGFVDMPRPSLPFGSNEVHEATGASSVNTICGYSQPSNFTERAWVFDVATSAYTFLPLLPGADRCLAHDMSANGSRVAGHSLGGPPMPVQATLWTNSAPLGLGDLPGGLFTSSAWGISPDGELVVGVGRPAAGNDEAFLWTADRGMIGLGLLPGLTDSWAFGVSDNGVVVGRCFAIGSSLSTAFLWDKVNGMRSLQSVLTNDYGYGQQLVGWTLNAALDIASDGRTVVGEGRNPSGQVEAFLVFLP